MTITMQVVITLINHNIILQVAALALLLMPETRYAHIVMKRVTHDQALQWESSAHVKDGRQLDSAGCVLVDNSIQVWRPLVESAWHEHSSSLLFQSHSGWLSLYTWPMQSGSSTPHQGVSLNLGGILYLSQSGSSI